MKTFFEISINGKAQGRITFELFDDVPKTCQNFLSLCKGDYEGLHFKGSRFHRIIKDFMVQGGDIINGDGTGGMSIYGEVFDDESFERKHDQPLLLSSANKGPNTNSSQFFITSTACPHLDDKHVVFGRIISGEDVFRRIESLETNQDDEPLELVIITDCGQVMDPRTVVAKDIEEPQEQEVDPEETNPYIIGIAPPEETNVPLRFLGSGVGSRVFKPRSRPESATDKSGRKVRGRGLIKFDSGFEKRGNRRSRSRERYRARSSSKSPRRGRSKSVEKSSRTGKESRREPSRDRYRKSRSPSRDRYRKRRDSVSRSPSKSPKRARSSSRDRYRKRRFSVSRSPSPRRASPHRHSKRKVSRSPIRRK